MTTPVIMAYVPPAGDLVTGGVSANTFPDFVNNRLYQITTVGTTTPGIRQYNGYNATQSLGGVESASKTAAQLGVPNFYQGFCLTASGYLIANINSGNSCELGEFAAATLTLAATFGASSGSTSNSTATRICEPNQMVGGVNSGVNYAVSATLFSINAGEVNVLSTPSMVNVRAGATAQHQAILGPGGNNTVFVLDQPALPTTASANLSSLTLSSATLNSIGAIAPSAIDATWSHFSAYGGTAYDATDGNILAMFETNDSVTNTAYIVKIKAADASILWAVPITHYNAFSSASMSRSSVLNSTYYYLDGSNLIQINTTNGTHTTTAFSGLSCTNVQFSEDTTGSIIYAGSATPGFSVTYAGNYMGVLGNHSVSAELIQFWPNGVLTPPPVPPPVTPPVPTISTRKAWTYVMDGHRFYVLDLGPQGTFAYDLTTKQWCEFVTNYNGNTNWNMQAGVMWGQRVVACDIATDDVWEMVPGTLTDNGSQLIDIQHTVTGGLVLRTRTYRSVAALRLTVSAGYLTESGGGSMSLSYSDDRGNTWVNVGAPASGGLVEGTYNQEIVWRSIGAFAAPGRVFSITDTGGFLAIDGCDADIDDFDGAQ